MKLRDAIEVGIWTAEYVRAYAGMTEVHPANREMAALGAMLKAAGVVEGYRAGLRLASETNYTMLESIREGYEEVPVIPVIPDPQPVAYAERAGVARGLIRYGGGER